jgi:branched-chain amino acid transport system permease protein
MATQTQVKPQASAPSPQKRSDLENNKIWVFLGDIALAVAFPFILRPILGNSYGDIMSPVNSALIFVLLALGLNIVTGYAGLLDLGYAAFFAIGAYTMGFLTARQTPWYNDFHLDFWVALPLCFIVTAIFGILLGAPTLGLKGDYLAIVTLGFGEIVPITFQNLTRITQGDTGLAGFVQPSLFGFQFTSSTLEAWYLMTIAVVIFSIFLIRRLVDSRIGRAWMAIREDEIAASAMGLSLVKTKLLAFAMGASFAGFAGAIYANSLGSANPSQFKFDVSILVLCMVILGGMGNLWGVIFGALTLILLDKAIIPFLTGYVRDFAETLPKTNANGDPDFFYNLFLNIGLNSRLLVFGLILVIMMQVRPEGLFPSGRRKMELRAGLDTDVQTFIAPSEDPLTKAEESHNINYNPSITESSTKPKDE